MIDPSLKKDVFQFFEQNWLNLIFGLFGVIGTVATILAFRNSRRQERAYDYLLRLADLNIDKNVTEEALAARKEEVSAASKRIEALQRQIQHEIPKEARRAVLRDRLDSELTLLTQHLDAVRRLNGELNALGVQADIPKGLLTTVENEINPEYLLREKRGSLKTYLTIVTAFASLASTLLPYPLNRWMSYPLLVMALPILIALAKATLPSGADARRSFIDDLIRWGSTLFGAACWWVFALGMFGFSRWRDPDLLVIPATAMALGLAFWFVAAIKWWKVLRDRRKRPGHRASA